ncbi:Protein of unknown function [Robiginitalea myxolifaciens]|uniref:DUF3667 domain-containing protein n=1 Tax=Robiginitalea myxolifaciens TaxID=400055 RepID=A0A1I6HE75_9FLAO|nr:DUF3667 domain-containing protein [Robiginitalea myxolifaciens]SFR52681.1 Protein of unknown function [Robiginitalea myxolifaciens]
MNCKNCNDYIQHEYRFCPNCGAKTEVRRVTFKTLIKDFLDRVFDLDNSLFRTIKGMILRPEAVIDGYLSGLRKRYLNPVSVLGISLTLAGLMIFVMQKMYGGEIDFTGGAQNVNPEFSRKWGDIMFDFNAVFYVMNIPILALPAFFLFNRRKYNLAEHHVALIYCLSTYSIISFPISMVLLITGPDTYLASSQWSLAVMMIFTLYIYWRLNRYKAFSFIWRSLLYILLVVILFFMLIIGLLILLIVTDYFSLEDFRPVEPAAESALLWIGEMSMMLA